jgi:hypothetical protein
VAAFLYGKLETVTMMPEFDFLAFSSTGFAGFLYGNNRCHRQVNLTASRKVHKGE